MKSKIILLNKFSLLVLFVVLSFFNTDFAIADEGEGDEPVEILDDAVEPLVGSCSSNVNQILQNNTVTWTVSGVSGGSGVYTYSWSGDHGLGGSDISVEHFYSTSGNVYSSVDISDGIDTITVDCNGGSPVYIISFLEFNSCYPEEISYTIGYGDTFWSANISGGIGPYTIHWDIDEGLVGNGSTKEYVGYTIPGEKTARVLGLSSSDGQTLASPAPGSPASVIDVNNPALCSPNIIVYEDQVPDEPLQVSCFANTSSTFTGTQITWSANITGGFTPYLITWNGTDDLSGSNETTSINYDTAGTKIATLMVRDSAISANFRNVPCGSVEINNRSLVGGGGGGISTTTINSNNLDEDENSQLEKTDNLNEVVIEGNAADELASTIKTISADTSSISETEQNIVADTLDELEHVIKDYEDLFDENYLAPGEDAISYGLLANIVNIPTLLNTPNYIYIIMGLLAVVVLGFFFFKKRI